MKDKALWIVVGLLVAYIVYDICTSKQQETHFSANQMQIWNRKLNDIENTLKTARNDIKKIKLHMVEKDSLIDSANSKQLDSLFDSFFQRTHQTARRQP